MSRKRFLENCLRNDVLPSFLKFRVPENGCFERTLVHNFQLRLLRRELTETIKQLSPKEDNLKVTRAAFSSRLIETLRESACFYTRQLLWRINSEVGGRHSEKLEMLSKKKQGKPLRAVGKTV